MNETDKERMNRPLAAYAVASQVAFIVLVPLLAFSVGGPLLVDKLGLPGGLKIIFVLLGVFFMIGTLISYLMKLTKIYGNGKTDKDEYLKYKYDGKDYDFYDDNVKRRL